MSSRAPEPFEPIMANCPEHGPYPRNMQAEDGRVLWYPGDVCPACVRRANASSLLANCNIPQRFAECSFENFTTPTKAHTQVLKACRVYANQFAQRKAAGASLILCGEVGTGKNHLATAVCRQLIEDGFTILRVKAAQYLDAYWAKEFKEREEWMRGLAKVDLLMIDEIGRSSNAKSAQDAFFRLIDGRYEAVRPSLITTNLDREGLIEVLGDATYDRLTQGGSVRLTLDWESHRAHAGKAVTA